MIQATGLCIVGRELDGDPPSSFSFGTACGHKVSDSQDFAAIGFIGPFGKTIPLGRDDVPMIGQGGGLADGHVHGGGQVMPLQSSLAGSKSAHLLLGSMSQVQ